MIKVQQGVLRYLYNITGKNIIGIFILTLAQALLGASSVCFAMLLRGAIDGAERRESKAFFSYFALLTGLIVAQIVLRMFTRYLEEHARSSVENELKSRLFRCLLDKDFASVTNIHSGEWMNRLTSDTSVVAGGLLDIIPNLVGMAVKLIGALSMILVLEPRFAYILVPCGAFMMFFTYGFRKKTKQLHKNVQEADGKLRIFLQERLGSLLMLHSFAVEGMAAEEAESKMEVHKGARMKKTIFASFCNGGFAGAMNGMYLLGLGYCGYGILQGNISYGTLSAILQLITQIQMPFANISGFLPRFYTMAASAERLMEAECYADDRKNLFEKEYIREFYKNEFSSIHIDDVSFAYPNEENENLVVLHGLSLDIQKGDYVAFTGHSGCGKSTLLKLLLSLYPFEEGKIFLQTEDGKQLLLDGSFRRLFAYVPQGNQLMTGTIKDIITFTEKNAPEDKVMGALKIACAEGFVGELAEGIHTVLGERGTGLSEGQMQRIAIARAIYAESPILLLDEATSALDDWTERELLTNLKNMTDKTVLIITHRPAALDICNKVFQVAEDGVKRIRKM